MAPQVKAFPNVEWWDQVQVGVRPDGTAVYSGELMEYIERLGNAVVFHSGLGIIPALRQAEEEQE